MMAHRHSLRALAVKQIDKPAVTQFSAGHFHRFAGKGITARRHIEISHIKVDIKSLRNSTAMIHVAHRFFAAQMEIAVCRTAVIAQTHEHS